MWSHRPAAHIPTAVSKGGLRCAMTKNSWSLIKLRWSGGIFLKSMMTHSQSLCFPAKTKPGGRLSLHEGRHWEHGVHILTEVSFHLMQSQPWFPLSFFFCFFFSFVPMHDCYCPFPPLSSIFPLLSFLHPHTSDEWHNRRRSGVIHSEEARWGETDETSRWRTERDIKTERRWDSGKEK